MSEHGGPRVDAWGGFDVENYGDALFPRIFELEMRRRLPDASFRYLSPFGSTRPLRMNRGWPIEALGRASDERRRELAAGADLVVIGGGEIAHVHDDLLATVYGLEGAEAAEFRPSDWFLDGLGPELERRLPVAWHGLGVPFDFDEATAARVRSALSRRPYVTVRDDASLARLRKAGVMGPIEVVPDSGLLLPRLLDDAELDRRITALKRRGQYPVEGRPLVLHGSAPLARHAGPIAAALEPARRRDQPLPVLLVETGPALGDARFLDAVEAELAGPVHRLATGADVEDIAAVIRESAAYVGSSLHGAITALAYGRPLLILNIDGRSKLDSVAEMLGVSAQVVDRVPEIAPRLLALLDVPPAYGRYSGVLERLDRHFDQLASLAADRKLITS